MRSGNGFNLLTLDGRRVTLAVHTVDSGGSAVRDRHRFDAATGLWRPAD
jgi:hypothetical protein